MVNEGGWLSTELQALEPVSDAHACRPVATRRGLKISTLPRVDYQRAHVATVKQVVHAGEQLNFPCVHLPDMTGKNRGGEIPCSRRRVRVIGHDPSDNTTFQAGPPSGWRLPAYRRVGILPGDSRDAIARLYDVASGEVGSKVVRVSCIQPGIREHPFSALLPAT